MSIKQNRFTSQDLDEQNQADLQKWINEDVLHAIIDERLCGIIGYVHHKHIDRVVEALNAAPEIQITKIWQPEFDSSGKIIGHELEDGLFSFEVYSSKEKLLEDFPNCIPVEYDEDGIEEYTLIK